MDLNSMIELAGTMGISLTAQQLQDLSLKSPLDALIKNVDMQQGRVYFRGGSGDDDIANDGSAKPMSPDQARKTVDNMAKRAAKKDL